LYTTLWLPSGCVSRWVCLDIDHHGDGAPPEALWRAAEAWYGILTSLGFHPLLIDSNGHGGFRIYVVFNRPTPTLHVRRLGLWLVRNWKELGLSECPEVFPKQAEVTPAGSRSFGNWLRLPGRHHKRRHWSRVWDGSRWLEGDEAIDAILAATGDDPALIPTEALTVPEPEPREKAQQDQASNGSLKPDPVGTPRRTIVLHAPPRHEHDDRHLRRPEVADEWHINLAESDRHVPRRTIRQVRQALHCLGPGARDSKGREYLSHRETWIQVGMALHDLGKPGFKLWVAWSKLCPEKFGEHGEQVCQEMWNGFRRGGGVNAGWLIGEAKKQGYPGKRKD
jgi:hypothetical protein